MTLSDLERRDAIGPIFSAVLRAYDRTVWPIWPTAVQFGMLTLTGRDVLLGCQQRHHPYILQTDRVSAFIYVHKYEDI